MVQEVAEQNLRGCTTLIQVRKVAELDWRDFPTNLPTFVPTFVLGNIYKWLICICILIDFERIARVQVIEPRIWKNPQYSENR